MNEKTSQIRILLSVSDIKGNIVLVSHKQFVLEKKTRREKERVRGRRKFQINSYLDQVNEHNRKIHFNLISKQYHDKIIINVPILCE